MRAVGPYIRPGRMPADENSNLYPSFSNKVINVLEQGRSVGFFDLEGALKGKKCYQDHRIASLEDLCSSAEFQAQHPQRQVTLLGDHLNEMQASSTSSELRKKIIPPNNRIEEFLKALENQDEVELDKILTEIKMISTIPEEPRVKNPGQLAIFFQALSHIESPWS